jgi:hypothetical protein
MNAKQLQALSDGETTISQYDFDSERGFAQGPERALMSALLFDGVQAYLAYFLDKKGKTSDSCEAAHWVHDNKSEYIFSFNSVCEGLGIDPNYLRYGLINAVNSAESTWKRARRSY